MKEYNRKELEELKQQLKNLIEFMESLGYSLHNIDISDCDVEINFKLSQIIKADQEADQKELARLKQEAVERYRQHDIDVGSSESYNYIKALSEYDEKYNQ